VFLLQMALT